jgi:hypothetical protein
MAASTTSTFWTSGASTRPTLATRWVDAVQRRGAAARRWGRHLPACPGSNCTSANLHLPCPHCPCPCLTPATCACPAWPWLPLPISAVPVLPCLPPQMPKTYSFLVKYPFLWRAAFNAGQVRMSGARRWRHCAALYCIAGTAPCSVTHSAGGRYPLLPLPGRPACLLVVLARSFFDSTARYAHLQPCLAHAPACTARPACLPIPTLTDAPLPLLPPALQPRLVHVPASTLSAAIVGRRISEAFDQYQPDLVVSVHPLMQVGGWACTTPCAACRTLSARSVEARTPLQLMPPPPPHSRHSFPPSDPPLPPSHNPVQHVPLRIMRQRIRNGMQPPTNFATVVTDLTTCHNTWFHPGVDRCGWVLGWAGLGRFVCWICVLYWVVLVVVCSWDVLQLCA